MKRKYLYLISIFILFSVLLTGCGGSDSGGIVSSNADIISVNSFSSNGVIEVDYGTSKSSALPQEVSVKLSNGNNVKIPVDWTDGTPTYNRNQAGTYKFIGFFDLSNLNYKNPDNISLEVEVILYSPEVGSKNNPAQIGDVVNSSFDDILDGQVNLTLEMTEIISGDEAWTIIQNSNQFNEEPATGQEYILVKYTVNLTNIEDGPYSIGPVDFDAVSENGVLYDEFFSVVLDNELDTDLYEGATTSGYIPYLVDVTDNPYGVFNRKDGGEIWFDISN